jgi:hypothetical protein
MNVVHPRAAATNILPLAGAFRRAAAIVAAALLFSWMIGANEIAKGS